MYRVLIVDDEAHARTMVESLVPWDEYGLELVGMAANGAEALEKLDALHPDLVITDIQMPHMDGIELIRRTDRRAKFIVMSGYNDFEYVRASMKLGALNYLLKPVAQVELQETLMECINILDRQTPIQPESDETVQTLRDYTLWRLLQGQLTLQELREKSKFLSLQLRCPRLAVALFAMPVQSIPDGLLHQMRAVVQQTLLASIGGYSFLDNTGNLVVVLTYDTDGPDCTATYDAAECCAASLAQLLQVNGIHAVVGPLVANALELPSSYQSALSMQQYHVLMPELVVLHPQLSFPVQSSESFCAANPITVRDFLQDQNGDGLRAYLAELLPSDTNIHRVSLGYRAIEIASILFSAAEMKGIPRSCLLQLRKDFFSALGTTTHSSAIRDCLFHLADQLLALCQNKANHYSAKIRLALEAVHASYGDQNFSLKTLADTLNINSAYLGRQFKLETGEFFSDYLNTLRIQKAQELFTTTNLSASEISTAVGYTTTNYFYSIFKKIVGVSTSAYRNARFSK